MDTDWLAPWEPGPGWFEVFFHRVGTVVVVGLGVDFVVPVTVASPSYCFAFVSWVRLVGTFACLSSMEVGLGWTRPLEVANWIKVALSIL